MRCLLSWVTSLLFSSVLLATAGSGKVLKVLPHFLDQAGRHTLSPSLFERDAYQAQLRKNPSAVSTVRFDVNWSAAGAKGNYVVRVELRGNQANAQPRAQEAIVKVDALGSTWSAVLVDKAVYQQLGGVAAWRVTLWQGEQMLAEQKSFLW